MDEAPGSMARIRTYAELGIRQNPCHRPNSCPLKWGMANPFFTEVARRHGPASVVDFYVVRVAQLDGDLAAVARPAAGVRLDQPLVDLRAVCGISDRMRTRGLKLFPLRAILRVKSCSPMALPQPSIDHHGAESSHRIGFSRVRRSVATERHR